MSGTSCASTIENDLDNWDGVLVFEVGRLEEEGPATLGRGPVFLGPLRTGTAFVTPLEVVGLDVCNG